MKFYTILLAIINVLLLNTRAKSTLYHGRSLGQIAPVPFQPLLLGLRRLRQFTCSQNGLTNCPTTLPLRFGLKRVQNKSKVNPSEKPDKKQNFPDLADVYTTPRRLTWPLVTPIVNTFNMGLKKPKSFRNVKTVETTSERVDNAPETCTEKLENVEKALEVVVTTPKFVDSNISPAKENVRACQDHLDRQNILNERLIFALDQFERKLYTTNAQKFLALTPPSKGNNGKSFIQSGLFLEMVLMALSTKLDNDTKTELDENFGFNISDVIKTKLIKQLVDTLPNSSEGLKFRWSSRLVLHAGRRQLGREFSSGATAAMRLKIDHFNDTQPEAMARALNIMIEDDSDGAIRDTFDAEDLSENEQAVLVSTLYFRARWRSAPTLLNGTMIFQESGNALPRTVRMIRINDVMKYVDLPEWDSEAIEIPYSTQGLSLLLLVPRGNSLRHLVGNATSANLTSVTKRMQNIRIAVALPLYTLRMTLLLPDKLRTMGISRIVDTGETEGDSLRISQAVQRIMFWAEAGRNAFKDDGLEWDETPDMKIVVDRPYIFCVRWQHLTLMLGNFVL